MDYGVLYLIKDNKWVNSTQSLPKRLGSLTIVLDEKNELVSMRPITWWRGCMDYRMLNSWTQKDHFPMSFMDQMLERLADSGWYIYLKGYLG